MASRDGRSRWDTSAYLGPIVIAALSLQMLLPIYFLLNALLIAGRAESEWALRNALQWARIISIPAELLWSAYCPQGVSLRACAAAAVAAAGLHGTNVFLAFAGPTDVYCSGLCLFLSTAALLLEVPVAQVGHIFSLRMGISQLRYKNFGFAIVVWMGIGVLLTPRLTSLWCVVPCSTLPLLLTAGCLLSAATDAEACAPTKAWRSSAGNVVTLGGVVAFVVLGCCIGTLGEAITDVAFKLVIRKAVQGGHNDLAITESIVVFCSSLLAYWSDSRPGKNAESRTIVFISAWTACQAVRISLLDYMTSGSATGLFVVALLLFLDKYTGPLGGAALDMTLLRLMNLTAAEPGTSRWTAPDTLLWTARNVIQKLERPICQLILLHTSAAPVGLVSGALALVTFSSVVVISKVSVMDAGTKRKDD